LRLLWRFGSPDPRKAIQGQKFKKPVTKAILLKFYRDLWDKEYSMIF
jgi:hypothetical protein